MEQREEYVSKSKLMEKFKERLSCSNKGTMAEAYYMACLDILDTEKGIYLTGEEKEAANAAL